MNKTATILCVDDEWSGLTGRQSLLEQSGYQVVITTSGREGLALLESLPVDAVILDYLMPEMPGDQVAARMKRIRPEIPIMMLSAHDALPQDAVRWTDTVLSKSAPPAQFVTAVHELVDQHSAFFHRWWQGWKRRLSA
jgi:CheY-like chemotaxis protein